MARGSDSHRTLKRDESQLTRSLAVRWSTWQKEAVQGGWSGLGCLHDVYVANRPEMMSLFKLLF